MNKFRIKVSAVEISTNTNICFVISCGTGGRVKIMPTRRKLRHAGREVLSPVDSTVSTYKFRLINNRISASTLRCIPRPAAGRAPGMAMKSKFPNVWWLAGGHMALHDAQRRQSRGKKTLEQYLRVALLKFHSRNARDTSEFEGFHKLC